MRYAHLSFYKKMNDILSKIDRIDNHLISHPHDYQSVIARMKLYSKAIDYQQRQIANKRLKKVAEYRRRLNEQS